MGKIEPIVLRANPNYNFLGDDFTNQRKLGIISTSNDPATKSYLNSKISMGKKLGIPVEVYYAWDHNALRNSIIKMNNDSDINGYIIQMPLDKNSDFHEVSEYINMIDPSKDLDGLNKKSYFNPATPLGIMRLLEDYSICVDGKDVIIINRSELVGKPLARLMTAADATVTLCHSHTKNLKDKIKNADIVVSAVGKCNFINKEDLSGNQILIDVGFNRDENNEICGDFSKDCYDNCYAYTPVPGGVGKMTVWGLFYNYLINEYEDMLRKEMGGAI